MEKCIIVAFLVFTGLILQPVVAPPSLYRWMMQVSAETQTEAFMDRPPSPLFVPAKSGVDAETQVVVGELFEFDLEV